MPSTYGMVVFTTAYLLYCANWIGYDRSSTELHVLCILAILSFVVATVAGFSKYVRFAAVVRAEALRQGQINAAWILLLHLVGILGIGLHFRELASYYGSYAVAFLTLASSGEDVRSATSTVTSVGTQLSYMGWMAIWLTVAMPRNTHAAIRWTLRILVIVQFLANLTYVDRIRPIWILVGIGLIYALRQYETLSTKRVVVGAVFTGTIFVSLFILIGAWVGKVSISDSVHSVRDLFPMFEPFYFYLTSGFAYLNLILLTEAPSWDFTRSFYPAYVALAKISLVPPIASQVNEFKLVPLSTNVGTFMEQLYRDGGVSFVIAGLFLHSFVFNRLGLVLLRAQKALPNIAWMTLCFVNVIGFFAPKYSDFPVWLFVGLGVVPLLIERFSHRSRYDRVGNL